MISACRTVDRRWATMRVVRFALARRRDRWMAASVSLSTALVASSSTRIGGVAVQRSGHGDALPLAAREPVAALADRAVDAVGEGVDEGEGLGGGEGVAHAGFGCVGCDAVGDVVEDGAVGEEGFLGDVADAAAQVGQVEVGDRDAVEGDVARAGGEEPEEEAQQGRLAASRCAPRGLRWCRLRCGARCRRGRRGRRRRR